MDFTQSLEELNTILGDTDNTTFTPEEKERALKKAWRDSYVVATVFDDSLTYTSGTFDYAIPDTITTVKDVYIALSTSDAPEPIPSDMWEVVDGRIYFNNGAGGYIPHNTVLTLKGNYKLDHEVDTIDSNSMQEYVTSLAALNTLTLLGYKKANLFLKNDTTMSELIILKRELQNDVTTMRRTLLKEYENA